MKKLRSLATSVAVLAVAGGVLAGAATADAAAGSAKPARCAESQLRASVKAAPIAGLKLHVVRLDFANTSTRSCTLFGFPGAAVVDRSGTQVKQARRVIGGAVGGTIEKPRTVTLRPGKSAYAWLEGASTRKRGSAQAGCDAPKYPRILVTPPNTSIPVPFTIGWPQCHTFHVHPVRID